ncbi:MAG: prepilin-type N-terminal cleavage/methylation domain-containing protein [Bacillota bacterium]
MSMGWMQLCRENRRGFSLLEVMIVLVVIMVLTAIAIPLYDAVQQRARDRVDEANVRALNSATTQWMMESEDHDPSAHTTDSLRELIEDRLIAGWPESPNGRVYILEEGKWTMSDD